MSLWDKAKKALEGAADSVDREARQATRHYEISQLETERDRQLIEIGKRALEMYGQREIMDVDIKILANRIRDLDEQIESLRAEIQALRHAPKSPDE
jgi:chaperonin cofactor prefoldin